MRKKIFALSIVPVIFLGLVVVASAEASLPIDSMKMTVERIIQVVTDQTLQGEKNLIKRREAITKLVDQRFNFQLMSRLALGDNWDARSEAERAQFVALFSNLLKKTYIKRIESYSEEKVFFTKQDIKDNLAIVFSQFVKENSEVSIIYKLKKDGEDWLVFDVVIEGASVIKQYRRQFSNIILEEHFEGLIQRLEEKIKSSNVAS
jgi:phospholipid transport system substrate-binding protein